jgi:hypothetical protein
MEKSGFRSGDFRFQAGRVLHRRRLQYLAPKPHPVSGRLRNLLTIQEREQIPQSGESQQALRIQRRTNDFAAYQDWRAHPRAGVPPVLDDFRTIILNALLHRPSSRFIDSVPVRARNADAPQRDAGKIYIFPLHRLPVDQSHDVGEVGIVMVVKEKLFEGI